MIGLSRESAPVQAFAPGFGVPMVVTGLDIDAARPHFDAPALDPLGPRRVVMSTRSAALRGAAVGDVAAVEGWNGSIVELEVAAIVDDEMIGWAEILMDLSTADELAFDRVGLVYTTGTNADADVLRSELASLPVRVTGPDGAVDRTDFVLPTVMVKERFGEFSFRPTRGDSIVVDPRWEEENIVTVNVEPLGPFECHRLVVPYVRNVVADLERRGLLDEIDPADFQLAGGCYNARLIRGGDSGFALSRHAWGIAIDINPSSNRFDQPVMLSEEVGETFRRWGFAWGAGWLRQDGMHFEWTRPAVPADVACSSLRLVASEIPGVGWTLVDRVGSCP